MHRQIIFHDRPTINAESARRTLSETFGPTDALRRDNINLTICGLISARSYQRSPTNFALPGISFLDFARNLVTATSSHTPDGISRGIGFSRYPSRYYNRDKITRRSRLPDDQEYRFYLRGYDGVGDRDCITGHSKLARAAAAS